MTRSRYYSFVFPVLAMTLGFLGWYLNANLGLPYGPSGVLIAAAAVLGCLLPQHRRSEQPGQATLR